MESVGFVLQVHPQSKRKSTWLGVYLGNDKEWMMRRRCWRMRFTVPSSYLLSASLLLFLHFFNIPFFSHVTADMEKPMQFSFHQFVEWVGIFSSPQAEAAVALASCHVYIYTNSKWNQNSKKRKFLRGAVLWFFLFFHVLWETLETDS